MIVCKVKLLLFLNVVVNYGINLLFDMYVVQALQRKYQNYSFEEMDARMLKNDGHLHKRKKHPPKMFGKSHIKGVVLKVSTFFNSDLTK